MSPYVSLGVLYNNKFRRNLNLNLNLNLWPVRRVPSNHGYHTALLEGVFPPA